MTDYRKVYAGVIRYPSSVYFVFNFYEKNAHIATSVFDNRLHGCNIAFIYW